MWEICNGGPAESKVWGFLIERGQNPSSERQPHRSLIPPCVGGLGPSWPVKPCAGPGPVGTEGAGGERGPSRGRFAQPGLISPAWGRLPL